MSRRAGLFHDERGAVSSKRVVGVASGFTLIAIALVQVLRHAGTVQESVIAALAAVAIGVFASTTADKFSPGGRVDADVQRERATQELRAMPEGAP